jgi:hypothetical protein
MKQLQTQSTDVPVIATGKVSVEEDMTTVHAWYAVAQLPSPQATKLCDAIILLKF